LRLARRKAKDIEAGQDSIAIDNIADERTLLTVTAYLLLGVFRAPTSRPGS
jgi:hypothetical protein